MSFPHKTSMGLSADYVHLWSDYQLPFMQIIKYLTYQVTIWYTAYLFQ